ncbi:KAP family P-loop domain-containing protein [Scytonema hofmannii PCC 7110]|uniref:KAP family P-loop domain-containing protein n=1 Tax=Scytonema hofmannii PCC 7110 TaxID=128403 RepID=A0A139X5X2_9CYAN|nr:ATP-binding protein [Scytonema hofmannii]KYC40022.1 KAP family P-loop domain-containing protein [Scytonema hofmannii PCC 7110]
MKSIEDIIKHEVNPFDLINLKPGNFWGEQEDLSLLVESIHREAIAEIEEQLDLVGANHRSRTVLLLGDSGSGKSFLLGRLKRTFNAKAFFVYIGPWADSEHIWRHILRYTVDSLMQTPEGKQESQLILWLKSLSVFTKRSLKQRIFNDNIWQVLQSDRQKFIKYLQENYRQQGIYSSDIFFGMLHDLTEPELYPIACEWLRGDDLSEESMQALKVKNCIDSEDGAKNILSNFGKISSETQPIVLCFDNLDNIPRLPNGSQDFQALFNVNTTIHNDRLKNFLIIISIITNTWKRNTSQIQQADKARIDQPIQLKHITLEQAKALWADRLNPLHQQANPQPSSVIFPLEQQLLVQNFPGGKTTPRSAMLLGRLEYRKYKIALLVKKHATSTKPPVAPPPPPPEAEFQLLWQQEYKKVQTKITKITLLSTTELIRMLQEALEASQVQGIKPKLLTGKYASYSLSYQHFNKCDRVGIVWTEDANMTAFYNVMNACQKAVQKNSCQIIYLIRDGSVGNTKLAGNQIYREVFTHTTHQHIQPTLTSVHYLATYHSLVNSALANELVVAGKTVSLEELQALIRNSQIFLKCHLLQKINILSIEDDEEKENGKENFLQVKEFLLNIVKIQGYMGISTLIQQAESKFPTVKKSEITNLIAQLSYEHKVKIINPKANLQEQLICLVAKI